MKNVIKYLLRQHITSINYLIRKQKQNGKQKGSLRNQKKKKKQMREILIKTLFFMLRKTAKEHQTKSLQDM